MVFKKKEYSKKEISTDKKEIIQGAFICDACGQHYKGSKWLLNHKCNTCVQCGTKFSKNKDLLEHLEKDILCTDNSTFKTEENKPEPNKELHESKTVNNSQNKKLRLSLNKSSGTKNSANVENNENQSSIMNLHSKLEKKDTWDQEKDDDDEGETATDQENNIAGVSSLHNLGNTCFFNSIIQILRYTPDFTGNLILLSEQIKDAEKRINLLQNEAGPLDDFVEAVPTTWKFVKNLAAIYERMENAEKNLVSGSSNYLAIRPYELLDTLEQLNPMFEGNLQQDAHEFLCCLLAYLQDSVKELNNLFAKYHNFKFKKLKCLKKDSYDFVQNKISKPTLLQNNLVAASLPQSFTCNGYISSKESSHKEHSDVISLSINPSGVLKRKRSSSDENICNKQTMFHSKITNFTNVNKKDDCDTINEKTISNKELFKGVNSALPYSLPNGINSHINDSLSFNSQANNSSHVNKVHVRKQKARKSFPYHNSAKLCKSSVTYMDVNDDECLDLHLDATSEDEEIENDFKKHASLSRSKVNLCSSEVDMYFENLEIDIAKKIMCRENIYEDFIENSFHGKLSVRTKCLECEEFKERREQFQDVSVAVRKPMSDYDTDDEDETAKEAESSWKWIISALKETDLLKNQDKYFCENCFALNEAEISTHYITNPPILTVHMKRFAASSGHFGSVSKINDHVPTPMVLPCIKDKCDGNCLFSNHRYELYGMVTHTGISISSGHYVSYVKSSLCELIQNKLKQEVNDLSRTANDANWTTFDENNLADPNNNMDGNNNIDSLMTDQNISRESKGNIENLRSSSETDHIENADWLEFDDDNIKLLSQGQFEILLSDCKLGAPYMLFYKVV